MSEDAEHLSDQSLLESTIFQQPRHAKVEQIQRNHDGFESYDAIINKLKEKVLVWSCIFFSQILHLFNYDC
jgi:hypothetical protein